MRWRRVILSALLVVSLGAAGIGGGFLWFLRLAHQPAAAFEPPTEGLGIAVLTGGPDRVETGLRLLAEGKGERLIISGVRRGADLPVLARLAGLDHGPLASRTHLGHAAATTHGNAVEIAAWAKAWNLTRLRVVTAWFHMPRALVELRRAMPEAELLPEPVAQDEPVRANLLFREYTKFLGAGLGLATVVPAREEARTR
ncbi:YdcF family protein [Acetobacteraceae bacterium H6797]|nr:YdcF family protein [Acetobacteraceae bacterium H6797]